MKRNNIPAFFLALALLLTACAPAAGEGEPAPAETEPAATDTAPVETPPEESPEEPAEESPSEPPEETPEESPEVSEETDPAQLVGEIWLYGEAHGNKEILEEEFRLWKEAYDRGVRHLFVEKPYYTAQFLNLWMAAEDDTILYELYDDWEMSLTHNEYVLAFYQNIKADCPETIFHGTDVQAYYETAQRYLKYLRENGQKDSEEYRLTSEATASDRKWYNGGQDVEYRESKMTENFVQTLERLDGEEIVGFYGGAHVMTLPFSYNDQTVTDSMASRLLERYGERVHLLVLDHVTVPVLEPERTDNILVGEEVYEASYFGKVDISSWSDYLCREFWRLEDAYDDFRDAPANGMWLPYSNYPTRVEEGQVFVIDYTREDGTVERQFFRSDGDVWQGMLTTVRIFPSE